MIAHSNSRAFVELSAVRSGVAQVSELLTQAQDRLTEEGIETVLFIDELHRFSKVQQDALLPGVENRWVTLNHRVGGSSPSQRTNFMYYFGLCLNQSLQHLDELIDVLR